MQHEIRYQPSYSLAILRLDPGEEVRCESGAMVSMSAELVLETKMNSGNEGGGFVRRAMTSATSGEGMVMEFTGPGEVWLQTRNAEAFSIHPVP